MHCLSPSSVLMWALMWVLMWIVMCVLMWILMWLGPHVSPYVSPQNPSASSHTPHTTTSALSGSVASPGLCVCSVCALCVLCVCSVCVLLLSGLPGQEAKLNIKSTKNLSKNATKIIDFKTQHRRFWDPFWYIQLPWPQHATHTYSSTGKRPTFYSKIIPKMDPKSRKMGVYVQLFFWCCSGTLFSTILSPKRSQNGTQKCVFFETSDLAKV